MAHDAKIIQAVETVMRIGNMRVTIWHREDGVFIGKKEEQVQEVGQQPQPAEAKP